MGGVDICPLLVLDFGQWNLSRSVSVLVLNRSSKKHHTFPPFLWRTCSLLWELHVPNGGCSFHPSHRRDDKWGRFKSSCVWGQSYRPREVLASLGWHRWARVTHRHWTSERLGLFVTQHCFSETDWYRARAGISNLPSGSETTIFSSCRILFLLIPLLIVWTVLSILCNKCKVESNLWAVSEARFILLFKRVSWNLPLFARWTASHHALVFSVSKCLC